MGQAGMQVGVVCMCAEHEGGNMCVLCWQEPISTCSRCFIAVHTNNGCPSVPKPPVAVFQIPMALLP